MSDPRLPGSPFRHCSDCGSTRFTARSEREFVCSDCGFRHFVTAIPAACVLLLDAEGRLLITRRAHEPGLGRLGLPGGVIDGHESGEEAAAREVLEEVGLHIPPASFHYFTSLPNRYLFQGFVWPTIDLFYIVRLASFGGVKIDPAEVAEWMAVPLSEVPLDEFAFSSNADSIRLLKSAAPSPPSSAPHP